ncbi:DNA primase family protein [Oceanispirochaeta crateris]|nr:phage/plasmid primase, P4 family [Oceanispirochaeta crateris]
MAERMKLKKLMIRLKRYEEMECNAVTIALSEERTFPEDVKEIMILSAEGRLNECYGLLSLMFNCYTELLDETRGEEIDDIRFFELRWLSYAKALKTRKEPKIPANGANKHIEREALRILATNRIEGGENYSDFFNARMMIEDWGEDIRYCAPWKMWMIWNVRHWKVDDRNAIFEMGKLSIEAMMDKAADCWNTDEALAMIAHSRRSSTARKIDSMLQLVRADPSIRLGPDDFDRDIYSFNCHNGIIDLHTGRLRAHNREELISKVSPVNYDPESACPVWKKFLKDIFDGKRELIKFVQKFVGCSLTGDMSSQAMFILYGTGANGKSTFINVITQIMGDYAMTTPTETFMQKKGEQATNDIARLKGARFVSATESDERGRLAESVIKRLTGNDIISARFLYGEYFQFIPTFKIVMATNHKPRISGMDFAIWRRIKLIPFEVTFSEEKQDKKLPEKLEKELPGILTWMVEGCLKWLKEGLGNPEAIQDATEEYRNQMSDIQMFLTDCCVFEEESMTQSSVLYATYIAWCEKNNERAKSNRNFSMMLSDSGMDKVRLSPGIFWIGVRVLEELDY